MHDDQVDRGGGDEHLTLMADEVQARLDEPVKQVVDHLAVLWQQARRQLVLHVGVFERAPSELIVL